MKIRDFERIGREIGAFLPGFEAKGQLLFANPVGDILRGFFFDGSDYSRTAFRIVGFFQPLFPAMNHVHLTFGERLRDDSGRDGWDAAQPDFMSSLRRAVLVEAPRIQAVKDATSAAVILFATKSENLHGAEAYAQCLARSNNVSAAQVEWSQLAGRLERNIVWQEDMLARIEALSAAFSVSDDKGNELLDTWANATRLALGLPDSHK